MTTTKATMQRCRSCGALIYWLKHTKTGKAAPIDAEPSATTGDLIIDLQEGTYFKGPRLEGEGIEEKLGGGPQLRYINHFATCPAAQDWKPGGARRDPAPPL